MKTPAGDGPGFAPLIVDLEVVPAEGARAARIIKIGALRPDRGEALEMSTPSARELQSALQRLDALAEGAQCVVGHNVLAHDLPLLRTAAPHARLLQLPVIDTLRLSPLAFPQNPYHRLIKDYKLISGSLNSPLADCRATWTLLMDQQQAFARLHADVPDELACYQGLIASQVDDGLGGWFRSISGQPAPGPEQLKSSLPALLRESDPVLPRDLKVCRQRLLGMLEEDLQDSELHWPIAYALAWLRVSGGNSVLAPWVRHQFPAVSELISQLRDMPCADPACQYCRTTHDPRRELQRYFGFDDFRVEPDGRTLQHDIVLAGMQSRHVLAILATGGGKSLCYQLPALNRYHRNGSLTIVISPLQSLMKDQVDGLLGKNVQCAATLNGMLTLPERADVLEKIQLGDVGILLVSPEQLRNKAFRNAIKHRQVSAWIFDEAHCLSKWGNDFRPDYLYASRFIREHSGGGALPSIGCFTATAKLDVLSDIRSHFRDRLGVTFGEFLGTHERHELGFDVLPCAAGEKWQQTHALLQTELGQQDGGAVVFVGSRKSTEELADFLRKQEWNCAHFHAGLAPQSKKDVQDAFIRGETRVIVATNAFGMGVDKKDIRLVVHADIPGSLENYLQEAGRAGRDQHAARCVLLYDPQDIETQFGLSERAKLTHADIRNILKKIRFESGRRRGGHLVITAGEILVDETVETSFEATDRDAETKVATAIAWLERGDYLRRQENQTRIFPARLHCATLDEACKRLEAAPLPQRRREEFRAVLAYLYDAKADERINTDQLMLLTGQTQEEVAGILKQLADMGLLINDTRLTVYLRHGTVDPSVARLAESLRLEQAMFELLREQAPDADQGGWQDLHLPPLTSALRGKCDLPDLLPLHVLRLLRSLAHDSDGENQHRGSIELRQISRDYLKLRIRNHRTWAKVQGQGDKRRSLARVVLAHLVGKLPTGLQGKDLLVEATFGELVEIVGADLELQHLIRADERLRAVEHVLLYLHQQEILTLNHGMTVMRRAMTIEVNAEKKGPYLKDDYLRLDEHYRERRIQVHVMREYAEIALREIAQALKFVMHYFTDSGREFQRRYFGGKSEVLKLATSEASWSAITGPLNDTQKDIVTDDRDRNRLILAGPGSGKTRVVVHRIAYLVRVQRVPPASIIALTFNRHAAHEIRQRLHALVGADAFGVTVLTYHAMAMRLTGTSFSRREKVGEDELQTVLARASALLEGKRDADRMEPDEGGGDDLRERLLRGYRYILVDEYQDIDEDQYRLVSALAGRHAGEDGRLCLLAVGDDDQNIYAFRHTSNRYIERFREDYDSDVVYLVENYRSTRHIIQTANHLIAGNADRLKAQHPIRIDRARESQPFGGRWKALDPVREGRTLCLTIASAGEAAVNMQAQAVLAELQRLLGLESRSDWNGCAVLAQAWSYLAPVLAWCEQHGVPYSLVKPGESASPLTRRRAFVRAVDAIRANVAPAMTAQEAAKLLVAGVAGTAGSESESAFFQSAALQMRAEFGECQLARSTIVDWLYDCARELRQQPRDGLFLGTVHAAKGLEFRHVAVLDGGWDRHERSVQDQRRLFYVGMTRARETLTLCALGARHPFQEALPPDMLLERFEGVRLPELDMRYQVLGLRDVHLDYAGGHPEDADIHRALRSLRPGDPLRLLPDGQGRYLLQDSHGTAVGRTSKEFRLGMTPERVEVAAVVVRYADDVIEESFRARLRCDRWEVVVPRIIGL